MFDLETMKEMNKPGGKQPVVYHSESKIKKGILSFVGTVKELAALLVPVSEIK